MRDVADIYFGHYQNSSAYLGDGKESIALSIQRSAKSDVIDTIERVESLLDEFRVRYPKHKL